MIHVLLFFRRKFHIQVTELEKQISALISKCAGLEKSNSRLQSEVDVLIIDLEKVIHQNTKEKFGTILFIAVLASLYSASTSIFKEQKRKKCVESEKRTKTKTRCFKKCCLNGTETAKVNKNTKTKIF